ncbi:MAG TPA: group III truncated hemoglobin [Chitinophagaceae bacterium]|nr:group III truncated hemoglobin [Chitinophagaceae bacterium]
MTTKPDIRDRQDIDLLVDQFYSRVRRDSLLSPIFSKRIPTDADWPHHLHIIADFWETVLFAKPGYFGNPFPKHVGLEIKKEHFDRWIELFYKTIDEHFEGLMATDAKQRAAKMRTLFEIKLGQSGKEGFKSLV